MAESLTIARPYAEAVFRLAQGEGTLAAWSDMLGLTASVAAAPDVAQLIGNPKVTARQLGDLFLGVCGDRLTGPARNFVLLLIDNRRLGLLPEIRILYEQLRTEAENVLEATVFTAFPLADSQVKDLVAKLESKHRRKIAATVQVDPDLIGGIRIQVGDKMLDASVRGQLESMGAALRK